MLRRQVSGRARALELAEGDPNLPPPPAPENVPISPTDTNLSPCSKKLWGQRKASDRDVRKGFAQRQWETTVSSDSSEESEESSDEEEMAVEEVKDGNHTFFSNCGELKVVERPCPSKLPVLLGNSSRNAQHVMGLLGWKYKPIPCDLDESTMFEDKPMSECSFQDIAMTMSQWRAAQLLAGGVEKPAILVTVGQVAEAGQGPLLKPANAAEARTLLSSYSNHSVRTVASVTVTNTETGDQVTGVENASVAWGLISDDVIDGVITRGTALASAGALGLDDVELRPLALHVQGSVDTIWGLPVDLLCSLISQIEANAKSR